MKSLIILFLVTSLHAQTFSKMNTLKIELVSGGNDASKHITVVAPVLSASDTLTLPASNAVGYLSNDGSGTLSWVSGSTIFVGAGVIMGTSSATNYYAPVSSGLALQTTDATGLSRITIPRGGTIKNLNVSLSVSPGNNDSRTFTFTKNGTAQLVTCAISGSAISAHDLTHSFTVAAQDEISLKVVSVKGGGNIGAGVPIFSFELDY